MNFREHFRAARTAFLIGLGVFIVGGLLWRFSGWQVELRVYDFFVRIRASPPKADPRIIVVELTENDIQKLDYPLRDKVLSQLLEKIETGHPSQIGNDFYRDLPVPRDGSEIDTLNGTLTRNENIISIFQFGDAKTVFAIPPPPIHTTGSDVDPGRYGFNNFAEIGEVRRGLFYLTVGTTAYDSFGLLLAQYYLQEHHINVETKDELMVLGKTIFPRFHRNDGGYVDEYDGGYQFLQDFRGPRRFDSMSVVDVLSLQDTSIFKDKIVMVGNGSDSSNDRFSTPVNAVPIPGVEVHAGIVDQLLRAALDGDKPISSVSMGGRWLWLAFWCTCGVAVGMLVRDFKFFVVAVVVGIGLIFLVAWLLFLSGEWILVFWPALEFFAATAWSKSYAFSHEGKQREDLMKLFAQSQSPEVAEYIWSNRETFLEGGMPVARRLVVTVLFTDLKDYSTISETMSPAELISWVNECHGALAKQVNRTGGILSCYMGDGTMAVFGIPFPRQQEIEIKRDAINAVTCALRMSKEIRLLNVRCRAEGKPLAGLRIGIFTGEAMAGMVGSNERYSYTVIGDTVNTASRLESVDKEGLLTDGNAECRIFIGTSTYNYIKDIYAAKHVGKVSLKGKAATTEVYKVLDRDPEPENNSPPP